MFTSFYSYINNTGNLYFENVCESCWHIYIQDLLAKFKTDLEEERQKYYAVGTKFNKTTYKNREYDKCAS
jgi:hypothetical protein